MKILRATMLIIILSAAIPIAVSQPLPVPRNKPAESKAPVQAAPQDEEDRPAGKGAPSGPDAGEASAPSLPVPIGGPPFDKAEALACEADLVRLQVRFKPLDPIDEKNGCGAQRPLLVESLGKGISLTTKMTARCPLVLALARWARDTVAPAAALHLGAELKAVVTGTSYQCRRRNNLPTGKLSEHAFANGLDITGFSFASREAVPIAQRTGSADAERAFQAAARGAACAYFTTVLGPGTDATHQGHLHLDLAYRSGGYRLCQ